MSENRKIHLFMLCVIFPQALSQSTLKNETSTSKVRLRRGGFIKSGIKGVKWTMRWFRVKQAMDILLTDAKLIKIDRTFDIEWYQKVGGQPKAYTDFWKISVAKKNEKDV